MADRVPQTYMERAEEINAQGLARFRWAESRAAKCSVCRKPMLLGGIDGKHVMCDPRTIVGRACSCPPDCSRDRYGDQGTCALGCEVCGLQAGALLVKRGKRG